MASVSAQHLSTAVDDLQLSTSFQDLCDAGYPITAICERLDGADVISLAQAAGKQNRASLLKGHVKELELFLPEDDYHEDDYNVAESYRSLAKLLMRLDGLEDVIFGPASAYLPGLSFLRLLPNLRSLTLLDQNDGRPLFPDACLQVIAELTELRELDISSVYGEAYDYDEPRLDPRRHGVAGARHLSKLENLEHLDVSHNDWGGEAFMEIGELYWLSSLRMAGNRLDEEGAEALANLAHLTLLDCAQNSGRLGGTAGVAHIATLTGLLSLSIESNKLGNAPVAVLARLTNLVSLHIGNNKLTASAAAHIGKLTQLTLLSVSLNRIADEGAEHLTTLQSLKVLSITHTGISTTGVAHISKLPALTLLSISHNALSTDAQVHIAKLTCLTRLEFAYNPMISGQESVQLSSLTRLRFLMWSHTGWSNQHFEALQTVLPQLRDEDEDWL